MGGRIVLVNPSPELKRENANFDLPLKDGGETQGRETGKGTFITYLESSRTIF